MNTTSTAAIGLGDGPPPMGLATYAGIAAQLRAAPQSQTIEILQRYDLSETQWREIVDGWTRTIAKDIARGDHGLLLAYADAFRAAESRLDEDARAEPPSAPSAVPSLGAEVASAPPASVHLATFQLAALAALPRALPEQPSSIPHEPIDEAAQRRAILAAFSAVQPVAQFGPDGRVPSQELAVTADADFHAPLKAVLPFQPGPPGSGAPSPLASSAAAFRKPSGTLSIPMAQDFPPRLPFNEPPLASRNTAPLQDLPVEPSPLHSAAPPVPNLTLGQYASLCVELSGEPAHFEDLFRKYGIQNGRGMLDLHAAWAARFAADPRLAQRWDVLCAQHGARNKVP